MGWSFRASDYEEYVQSKTLAVSRREVTGFPETDGHHYRNRAYAEPGWGRIPNWMQ
jgi:hypothetical protein